jgi:hypothetical protein
MAEDRPFPAVPKDLLDRLSELYPDRLPAHPLTLEGTARLIGQQDVIRFLRAKFGRQTGNNNLAIIKA